METCLLQIFTLFRSHHAHVRKDTRLFPLFCTASDENWAWPGNKATEAIILALWSGIAVTKGTLCEQCVPDE